MVSSQERQKLIRQYRHEPVCVLGLMLKCIAGLLIIAGVALIGVQTNPDAQTVAHGLQQQRQDSASFKHGRTLQDEETARFAAQQNGSGMAVRSSLSSPVSTAGAPLRAGE